ncbi:MAG TPA: nucleotidyl transferase AbiEii/AbiGii toxin family protein, partial [Thermomicrobiales bacterium]|nr:nucleotidyl transferase AbiEii/AbiGii toxin family protein [Thermomicrobiales bacterium]
LESAPDDWMLKGGVALDYRLGDRARATRDVDLLYIPSEDMLEDQVAQAESTDLGDYFTFSVQRTNKLDRLTDGSAVRYHVQANLNGKKFDDFSLDVGFDVPPDLRGDFLARPGFLDFAGIPSPQCLVLAIEVHLAEKLHAYARSYTGDRPSSRVKDLVDMVLITQSFELVAQRCLSAIRHTFETRQVYPIPNNLPPPPTAWATTYPGLARTVSIDPDIGAGHALVAAMFDPLLAGTVDDSTWLPGERRWRTGPPPSNDSTE